MLTLPILASPAPAFAAAAPGPAYAPGEVLVKFRPDATAAKRQTILEAGRVTDTRPIGRAGIHLARIEGIGVEAAVALFQADPTVEYAEPY